MAQNNLTLFVEDVSFRHSIKPPAQSGLAVKINSNLAERISILPQKGIGIFRLILICNSDHWQLLA